MNNGDTKHNDHPQIINNDEDKDIKTDYDYLFKISLIGDSGTGKTSLLLRLSENKFTEDTSSTIGVDFKIISVKYQSKLAKVQIWDTCGSERFLSLTTAFVKSCSVFIMVFDLSNKKSFENLSYWVNLIHENTSPKQICLVGNKTDLLEENRVIDQSDILKFVEKHGMHYMETSAKNNENILSMFQYVSEELFKQAIIRGGRKDSDKFDTGYKSILTNPNDKNSKKIKVNFLKKAKRKCCS